MKNILLFLSFIFINTSLLAQKATISGFITDSDTGERLINANVYEKDSYKGSTANNFGFYSLSLPKGKVSLVASFIGYETQEIKLELDKDLTVNLKLKLQSDELDEVTVIGNQTNKVEDTQMSMIDLPIQKLQNIPVILGEADVLKVIQLLPGVQSGTEGTSGIYVRGGGPDQNLFLLDGVPVYNASHLLGFFSVFNPDAIKTVKLYKGGFPARFGGRLSSVVDISMKDGNTKKLKGNFSIGLISSKLELDGPLFNDKTTFMLSARRTYIDALAQPAFAIINATEDDYKTSGGAFFHDFNLKINHKFSDKSNLYLSGYHGLDKLKINDKWNYHYNDMHVLSHDQVDLGWGNTIGSLRWNYLINNKLFSNTTLTFSKYLFDININYLQESKEDNWKEEELFGYHSGIEDYNAKIDFDYFPHSNHSIKFGTSFTMHHFSPGVTHLKFEDTDFDESNSDSTWGNRSIYAYEWASYFEDEISIGTKLKLNAGLHLSMFNVDDQNFWRLQPRLSLRYKATDYIALKASYSRMAQHMHLLSTSGINLPTDLWIPITKNFATPISDQVAIGVAINMPKGFNLTVEGFYKTMENLIEYKEGASFMKSGTEWEEKVELGRGWSYGAEVMLEKTIGKTTGWIGYTWSKSERKFENINFGKVFPAKYDRRHDISIALTHKFNDRIDIGGTWVYGTGNAVTMSFADYSLAPIPGRDHIDDKYYKISSYKSRNNYRMPAYHRLDLGINFHKKKKRGIRTWSYSLYNAYSRQNPFYIYWETSNGRYSHISADGQKNESINVNQRKLKQFSLFPIIPSVSYSFKF